MWSALAPFHPNHFVSRSTQMVIIIDPVFSPSCSFYLKNSAPIQTGNGTALVRVVILDTWATTILFVAPAFPHTCRALPPVTHRTLLKRITLA